MITKQVQRQHIHERQTTITQQGRVEKKKKTRRKVYQKLPFFLSSFSFFFLFFFVALLRNMQDNWSVDVRAVRLTRPRIPAPLLLLCQGLSLKLHPERCRRCRVDSSGVELSRRSLRCRCCRVIGEDRGSPRLPREGPLHRVVVTRHHHL